jgi:cleavage and polyadenylation specificity factor subunit 1
MVTMVTLNSRLGSLKDTVSVVVVSLDLTAKIYPVIYSLDNLPYDCIKLVAMPKPVTGVLVIAANALLHVSQGSPGVGVAVNGYVKKMTDFHGMIADEKEQDLNLSLDGAKAMAFGGDKCFLFLQDGTFATVKMKMDGSKVVGMEIKLEAGTLASVPSCVASIKHDYFFLGSRVGDSLLIKWEYSNKAERQLQYKVCDTLLNTGPILDMAIGDVESNQVSLLYYCIF